MKFTDSVSAFLCQIPSSLHKGLVGLLGVLGFAQSFGAEPIAQAFEVRYFTQNPAAIGETDFKGKTEFLTTDQRVDFLKAYADYGRIFWGDPKLDKEVFPLSEARVLTQKIKPQPKPQVRVRMLQDDWAWTGLALSTGAKTKTMQQPWLKAPGLSIADGRLNFTEAAQTSYNIEPSLNWRGRLQLQLDVSKTQAESTFALGQAVVVGFDARQKFFYITDQKRVFPDVNIVAGAVALALEVDFTTQRFNVKINDKLVADYVPFSDPKAVAAAQLEIRGAARLSIGSLYGAVYVKQNVAEYPYTIHSFIDADFKPAVSTDGWVNAGYNDAAWARSALPIVHGGERYQGEALLLRKTFVIENPEAWSQALLNLETVVPSGTLYINGKPFEVIHDVKPKQIDIRRALRRGTNTIALQVDSYLVKEEQVMKHTSTDRNTGWFAGRIHLDLLKNEALDDVFVSTAKLANDSAEQDFDVTWHSNRDEVFTGKMRISLAPWFPREGAPVVVQEVPVTAIPKIANRLKHRLTVPKPALWTSDSPNLYLGKVELLDHTGAVVDDWNVTTGLRTVSQTGGTFRINGRPETLRAPLLFGSRTPLENISKWDKCPPLENLVQELTMIKRMNGNGVRMSVHDTKQGGINDPRIAEIADQMGLMLIWQTSAWLREGNVFSIDVDLLSADVHLVRNHPSIVMWQTANHPYDWYGWDNVMVAYRRIYDAIVRWDTTRLISPNADFRYFHPTSDDGTTDPDGKPVSPDPIWTAPLITRGNMDYICGYGNSWTALRKWPDPEKDEWPLYVKFKPVIRPFLESPDRAYFNFEHDESAAQPNWTLIKGQPYYHVASYEHSYEEGSIGRLLSFDEWDTSQAWQALIAYESIKKMRMWDYDGFSWCNLRGGPNTATYQKPLMDYEGVAKLAFYAHNMVFQNTVAGSENVDVVYGPGDSITPVIFNLGDARTVSLSARLLTRDGKILETKALGRFDLPAGRTFVRGTPFRFENTPADGTYVVTYVLE